MSDGDELLTSGALQRSYYALEKRVAELEARTAPKPAPELSIRALHAFVEVALVHDGRRNSIRVPVSRFAELRQTLDLVEARGQR